MGAPWGQHSLRQTVRVRAVPRIEQRLEQAIVEREHLVAARLLPPQVDQGPQPLGLGAGQVVELAGVLGHVVQLPAVLVEGHVGIQAIVVEVGDGVERHRLPAAVVDASGSEHLEVLGGMGLGLVGMRQDGSEADAIDRGLHHAGELGRTFDPDQIEDGGHDVDDVGELPAH